MMQSVVKQPTNYTPFVSFDPDGTLELKGRSLMLDAVTFYSPLIEWVNNLEIESVHFTIEIDYFNTSSSKKLLEILKILDGKNNIKQFVVYWAFESDDEDILTKGQILEERLIKAQFRFRELAGV
jgi:hypothetical protein